MATDLGKVGMVMKGDYNSASTYEALDAVSYQNGLYVAKQNVPAGTVPTNTTYWQNAVGNNFITVENITYTEDFYAEAGINLKLGVIHTNSYNICTLNGMFKNKVALTANTLYSVATMPQTPIRDCTLRVEKGIIVIEKESSTLKFSPSANMAQYDGAAISIPFISEP